MTVPSLAIWGVTGLPEVGEGDDLAAMIVAAEPDLRDGDVLVVTSKVVSKAEGRLVEGDRESHIDAESVRFVARRGRTRIVETRHGLVLAAAGIDASNVPDGTIALLPLDPDASARRIRAGVAASRGVEVAVVVSDTMGRPWRNGVVDVAIGASGLDVLVDLRGTDDAAGRPLEATVIAVADELASAADLVKGKLTATPVAVVRGFPVLRAERDVDTGAAALVRPAADDMFRLGTRESMAHVVAGSAPLAEVPEELSRHADAAIPAVRRALAASSSPPVAGSSATVVPAEDGSVRVVVTAPDPVSVGLAAGRLLAALAAEDLRGALCGEAAGAGGDIELTVQVVPAATIGL